MGKEEKRSNYLAEGISIGMCIGIALGKIIFRDIAIGVSIGMCMGIAIGGSIKKNSDK